MADYKELLRRAVEALPENNGAARRAVYEKARAALVGQLRAINPPLAARDITTHRLQLEDCIRQVEQEASEAVIAGMSHGHDAVPPPPVYFEPPPATKQLAAPGRGSAKPQLSSDQPEKGRAESQGASIEEIIAAADRDAREHHPGNPRKAESKPEVRAESKPMSRPIQLRSVPKETEPEPALTDEIEDEIEDTAPRQPQRGRPVPAIVARAEAAKNRGAAVAFGVPPEKPYEGGRRGPTLEARRDAPQGKGPRFEGARGPQLISRQQAEPSGFQAEPSGFIEPPPPHLAAMSAVREVEVEGDEPSNDPQDLIDRAMATLDREARGETRAEPAVRRNGRVAAELVDDADEDEDDNEVVQPARNGFIGGLIADAPVQQPVKARGIMAFKDKLRRSEPEDEAEDEAPPPRREPKARAFADSRPPAGRGREANRAEAGFPRARAEDERGGISAVTIFLIVFSVLLLGAGGAGVWAWNEGYLNLGSVFDNRPAQAVASATPTASSTAGETAVPQSGPGNTTLAEPAPVLVLPELKQDDRLQSQPVAVPQTPALAIAEPVPTDSQQRLNPGSAAAAIGDATGDVAALNPEGSQSLLLEASDDGRTGAVPFSGTIEWSQGQDETGLPTIVGKASIPARNLGVDILLRKNVDSTLPASHLMEVTFRVSDSFIGGSVAGLPGVLLKNEELVQGQPLVGASARVVGNSFLFALSAAPEDQKANGDLLTSRKWLDLALIYATGKRAIITLEKDSAAATMFQDVFSAWTSTASAQ